ncbi:MAG: hypothetical protein SPG55_00425 [Prevotella sp.]|nr:hypothetical protein [Prevotella sp.]MDD7029373.1 hypothetical protein [Prevotellaceae bacterium]MCI7017384.1 hypothetical protein [Prevotella sp.]MCI7580550.1 hypothetical protein [Prevotella sp.]MDD7076177.1 hypothetical protein [Prevotellaceae bacterium]
MSEKTIVDFQTKVRALILQFQSLKKENEELYVMLEKNEDDVRQLRQQLQDKQREFDAFKAAKMLEVADGDIQSARERLAKLIRDVNKCIAVLSEQK